MASVENLKFYRVLDASGKQINFVLWDLVENPDTSPLGTNITLELAGAGPFRERPDAEPFVAPPLPREARIIPPTPPADDEETP